MIPASTLWAFGLPAEDIIEGLETYKWNMIRAHRNKLLAECDWTQISDGPLSAEEIQAWADYRQVLRDIPQEFTTADDVQFPSVPNQSVE